MKAAKKDIDALLARIAQGVPLADGIDSALFPPRLVIDIREWHRRGVLRNEGPPIGIIWASGEEMLVARAGDVLMLIYSLGEEEITHELPLAWQNSRPSLICPCGRRVTKLLFTGHRFICRRCYEHIVLPRRPTRRPKRIPAKQRLRVLARDRFRCVGCHTTEGGLVVRRCCSGCESQMGYEFDQHLWTECRVCYDLSRGGPRGLHAIGQRLRRLGLWDLEARRSRAKADATSAARPRDIKNGMRSQNLDESQRGAATKAQIRIYKKGILRSLNRQKSPYRVLVKLVCGIPTGKIAAQERVNRSTVWRHRQRIRDAEDALFPLVAQMMARAARREDWDEARFWREALRRTWPARFAAEYLMPRQWMKPEQDMTAPRSVAREWRPYFEAIRDEALGPHGSEWVAA